jgi:ATP-dependent Clp protease ATP-binding subunit ClpA
MRSTPLPLDENAHLALVFAREESLQSGTTEVSTAHLLVGLTRFTEGVTYSAFNYLGIDGESLRKSIPSKSLESKGTGDENESETDAALREALRLASDEAYRLAERAVKPKHLLLGIVRGADEGVTQILSGLGIRLEKVRQAVMIGIAHERGTKAP